MYICFVVIIIVYTLNTNVIMEMFSGMDYSVVATGLFWFYVAMVSLFSLTAIKLFGLLLTNIYKKNVSKK